MDFLDQLIAGDEHNESEWEMDDPSRADINTLRTGVRSALEERDAKYAEWRNSVALLKNSVKGGRPLLRRAIERIRAHWGRTNARMLDYGIAIIGPRVPSVLPASPEAITAEPAGVSKIEVDWSNVTDAKFYELWRAEEDPQKPWQELQFALVKTLTKTIYTDTGLRAGRRYYYKVRAGNAAGMGEYSAVTDCVAP